MKQGIAWVGLVVAMAGALGCKTGAGVGGIGDECGPASRCASAALDCHEIDGADYCCNPEHVAEYRSHGLALDASFVMSSCQTAETLTGECFDERDCGEEGPRAVCLADDEGGLPFCSRACDDDLDCDAGDVCTPTTEGPYCIPE